MFSEKCIDRQEGIKVNMTSLMSSLKNMRQGWQVIKEGSYALATVLEDSSGTATSRRFPFKQRNANYLGCLVLTHQMKESTCNTNTEMLRKFSHLFVQLQQSLGQEVMTQTLRKMRRPMACFSKIWISHPKLMVCEKDNSHL